jgi:hypothetical protein
MDRGTLTEILQGSIDAIDDYCSQHGYPTPVDVYITYTGVEMEFEGGIIIRMEITE